MSKDCLYTSNIFEIFNLSNINIFSQKKNIILQANNYLFCYLTKILNYLKKLLLCYNSTQLILIFWQHHLYLWIYIGTKI